MPKVLFVCTHDSARSQMAEAYLKTFGGNRFEVESAGIEPGKLNPYVVRALAEDGIGISGNQTKGAFDLLKAKRLIWSYPDPSTFVGSDEEIMAQVRAVHDAVKERVRQFALEVVSLV
jgi:arsenate reductase